ncbi:MAG: nickel pincer cofactor biosynthesis protein LarB [Betaproteobacteria bacterium]|jgi:NCAIR mutase (PurE)-related protein
MTRSSDIKLDFDRGQRIGLEEAIFCEGKTADHIVEILTQAKSKQQSFLLTRLNRETHAAITEIQSFDLDYDELSQTAIFGQARDSRDENRVAIISAGTSDAGVAREAARTLRYYGHAPREVADVGVAGLWRLMERLSDIQKSDVLIVVAGMDAALPTVLGGLVSQPIIGVPTSVGYGVAKGGESALKSMLSSCSSGLTVTNIDNGYGAACAALRILSHGTKL